MRSLSTIADELFRVSNVIYDVLPLPLGCDFIREIADTFPALFLPTTDNCPAVLFVVAVKPPPLSPYTSRVYDGLLLLTPILPSDVMRTFSLEPSLFKNLVKVLSISNEPESFVFLNLDFSPYDFFNKKK